MYILDKYPPLVVIHNGGHEQLPGGGIPVPDDNDGFLGEAISISDLIAVIALILDNRPSYTSDWKVIQKGEPTSYILTNAFWNKIVFQTKANVVIENLGDRTTIYDMEACFITENGKRLSPENLLVNGKSGHCPIILDTGDAVVLQITAVLRDCSRAALKSLEKLELIISGTGSTVKKVFPINNGNLR